MERFCFPPITLKRKSVVLFVVQKPPFFVLRRVSPEYPLQTYTLNDCLVTFALLSRGDIFTPLQSAQDTHTITTISSWREKKKPKRSRSKRKSTNCWVWSSTCVLIKVPLFCMRCTSSRARSVYSFFSRANLFIIGTRERFFSSLRLRDDTDPFLSLFNARIRRRSTRTKRSFCENWSGTRSSFENRTRRTKERSERFVDATVRHSFPDRRRIGLSLSWRWLRRKLTMNASQLQILLKQ